MRYKPFEPPIKRNVIRDRITPNTSTVNIVCILPVFGSGRSSSKLLPRDTKISWDLVPEKLPCTACVMAVECCNVKLYKYMMIHWNVQSPPANDESSQFFLRFNSIDFRCSIKITRARVYTFIKLVKITTKKKTTNNVENVKSKKSTNTVCLDLLLGFSIWFVFRSPFAGLQMRCEK